MQTKILNQDVVGATIAHLKRLEVVLPSFSQLQEPATIPLSILEKLKGVCPDELHPLNLFRVHWHNDKETGGFRNVPEYAVLPPAFTGVAATIVVLFGDTFPMISAHKVLPAYACLVPRLITGQFEPQRHCAVWPSTGNYCRGGVAISRILGCRSLAVLPEGMSRERFEWLEKWLIDDNHIIRTAGTESNVKEIYDKCAELDEDKNNIIFNQFAEFGNYLAHYLVTGTAVEKVFQAIQHNKQDARLTAFVSATGSAGTVAAGDYLKARFGSKIAVAEPVECATLLHNGYGEHNIQGIGDKHVPYIHNVMNTDFVIGVSDSSSDALNVLFNTPAGQAYLTERKGLQGDFVYKTLARMGLSSNANILAAIKLAKHQKLKPNDVLVTIATDGGSMYTTEKQKNLVQEYEGRFDTIDAAEVYGQHLAGQVSNEVAELCLRDRERIFNLAYYTWVEQQHVTLNDFNSRRDPAFWCKLTELLPVWDQMISDVNLAAGVVS